MSAAPELPPPASSGTEDVRMHGFTRRAAVEAVLTWLDDQTGPLAAESISLSQASGRVLASPIVSEFSVPGFARSMMDGFALQAADVQGASSYNRLPLEVIGQALPGSAFTGSVSSGQAVKIMTGAPLPAGADSVLPAEKTDWENERLFAAGETLPGKHVGHVGEDIEHGSQVLPQKRRLRPQDLGVLSSIGVGEVPVVRQPRVRLLVTGDELLPSGSRPRGCQIVDANSPMLTALAQRDGGIVEFPGITPDSPQAILKELQQPADVVLVSGGSSVGQEDHAPMLLAEHGELSIHGVAMRPSSPAGVGGIDGKWVFLLPGNPVSCLCAYDFFAGRVIRALGGLPRPWPYRSRKAALRRKLVSTVGRVDYARVKLLEDGVEPLAISGASVLSSTTRADGFVVIPADSEGLPAKAETEVWLYD